MPTFADPSIPEEFPTPTPELVLVRVIMEAYFATTPRKRAIKQMRMMADILTASAEADANVLPFRNRTDREATMAARRQALAWFRQVLPAWMSALDQGQ